MSFFRCTKLGREAFTVLTVLTPNPEDICFLLEFKKTARWPSDTNV